MLETKIVNEILPWLILELQLQQQQFLDLLLKGAGRSVYCFHWKLKMFSTIKKQRNVKLLNQSWALLSWGRMFWWGDTRPWPFIPKTKVDSITALWVWRSQVQRLLWISLSGQHVVMAFSLRHAVPKRPWHLYPHSFLNFSILRCCISLWLTRFVYPKKHYTFDA